MEMDEGRQAWSIGLQMLSSFFFFSPAWKWRWINVHAKDDICYFLKVNLYVKPLARSASFNISVPIDSFVLSCPKPLPCFFLQCLLV